MSAKWQIRTDSQPCVTLTFMASTEPTRSVLPLEDPSEYHNYTCKCT